MAPQQMCTIIQDTAPVFLPIEPSLEQVQRYCATKCPNDTVIENPSPKILNQIMCNINNSVPIIATCGNIDTYPTQKNDGKINYFLAKHLPCTDYFDHNWGKCALVGNSGSFHRIPHPEIDDYQTVIRFNDAPVKNHEQLVGSRTDIRIFNQQFVTAVSSSPTVPDEFQLENSIKLLRYRGVDSISSYSTELTEHFFSTAVLMYAEHMREIGVCLQNSETYLRNETDYLEGVEPGFKSPSTGFFAVVLLSRLCEVMHMFGFKDLPTDPNHYYGRLVEFGSLQGKSHNFKLEQAVFRYWREQTDKFVFFD